MANDKTIKDAVRERYANAAKRIAEREAPPEAQDENERPCCGSAAKVPTDEELVLFVSDAPLEAGSSPTAALEDCGCSSSLYPAAALEDLPESVTDASLGCGNPTAIAGLHAGETVLDLGSGGGIDCFLAARRVGPEGHVIGLDMTPDMVELARVNATKVGLENVEFRRGEMEAMPVADESVDVVISNCVINLSPDKEAVFAEIFRVLRPGGRLAVSDIMTTAPLPDAVRRSAAAWSECVAGALEEEDYLAKLRAAGFTSVEVTSRSAGKHVPVELSLADVEPPIESNQGTEQTPSATDIAGRIASVHVVARKP